MKINDFTKNALEQRRFVKNAKADGYIKISESGDPLWQFARGGWTTSKIIDVRINPDGHELWILIKHHQ